MFVMIPALRMDLVEGWMGDTIRGLDHLDDDTHVP